MNVTYLICRVKAFSGRPIRPVMCRVDEDGMVSVWDKIAGHYTVCNSLSKRTQSRIRNLARRTTP